MKHIPANSFLMFYIFIDYYFIGVKPLMIGCGLLQLEPTPSVTVAFNQQIKVSTG